MAAKEHIKQMIVQIKSELFETERETSGNGTKQKGNQTAFVQKSKSIAIKKKTNRNWHNHTEYIVKCAKIAWWFWKTT